METIVVMHRRLSQAKTGIGKYKQLPLRDRMKESEFQKLRGARLDEPGIFDLFCRYVEYQTKRVKSNTKEANFALFRTGMYDADGHLKDEYK